MIESLLLINGLIFCYLLFSGSLSGKKVNSNKRWPQLGIGIFFILFVIISIAFYFNCFKIIEIIVWVAALASSAALIFKLFHITKR